MTRAQPLILNVDDDDAGRYAVGRTLRRAGYEVCEAATGEDGISLAVTVKPDLILLDIRLPDIDGFEVCRRIREIPELANTPIVQLSASYLDPSSHVRGLDSGADAYLLKPTEPMVLAATVNSILRMKRAEQTVLRSAQRWQDTFEAIGDGVAILDADGSIVQSNGAFQLIRSMAEDAGTAIAAAFGRVHGDSVRRVEEIRIGERSLIITLDPTFDQSHEVTGAVCIVSDVTERKRFEEQMRESARLESLGVMAGGIAHDFNNLLTGILGNASLLAEDANEGDRLVAGEIMLAAERAAELTKQMLAYSGKGHFNIEVLDLNTLIRENLTLLRATLSRSIGVELQLECETCYIEGDRSQMQQIVMNLLLNASESVGERAGRVAIRTSFMVNHVSRFSERLHSVVPAGTYALLEVTDDGGGMTQETMRKIFDPFFTTKFTGRGLGLAAVLGIVKGHKGDIEVLSEAGRGAKFRILLPAFVNARPAKKAAAFMAPFHATGQTVLVVDDEEIVSRMATIALESRGFHVIAARNGVEALQILREHHGVSVVILDLTMPVMTGEQALPLIRNLRPEMPVILSSGFGEAEISRRFGGAGIAGVLQKPYSVSAIVSKVTHALQPASIN